MSEAISALTAAILRARSDANQSKNHPRKHIADDQCPGFVARMCRGLLHSAVVLGHAGSARDL